MLNGETRSAVTVPEEHMTLLIDSNLSLDGENQNLPFSPLISTVNREFLTSTWLLYNRWSSDGASYLQG